MTEQEYIAQLSGYLNDYPEDVQQEILDTFISYFEQGTALGKSNVQIIHELGSVQDAYDNIRMTYGDPDTYENHTFSLLRDTMTDTWNSFENFIQGGFRDLFSGKTEPRNEADTIPVDIDADTVTVICPGVDLLLSIKAGPELSYSFIPGKKMFSSIRPRISITKKNGAVVFRVIATKSASSLQADLFLTIPDTVYNMQVDVHNGSVQIRELTCNEILCRMNTGKIQMDHLQTELITCQTKDADQSYTGCQSRMIHAQATEGMLEFRNCTSDYDIRNKDGDVTGERLFGHSMFCTTGSGDISLYMDCPVTSIHSTGGDVEITINQPPEQVQIETRYGDIDADLSGTDYAAVLETVRGTVENRTMMAEAERTRRRILTGSGHGSVYLHSKNGDILLR